MLFVGQSKYTLYEYKKMSWYIIIYEYEYEYYYYYYDIT